MCSDAGSKVHLTDGGFATQLIEYVGEKVDGNPLWSAQFNVTSPDSVYAVHIDFLCAGADLIRTNTYQASVAGYKKHLQFTDIECEESLRDTIRLAFKARDDFIKSEKIGRRIPVLASVGPYGAYLADGSEYNGDYVESVSLKEIKEFHKERMDLILKEPVDGLAIETIPSRVEAEILVDLINESYSETKFWISFNCKNESQTAHGEHFGETVQAIWDRTRNKENLLAIGVNCLDPKFVTPLFELIGNKTRTVKIPLVAYPNSGEVYDVNEKKWISKHGEMRSLQDYIPEWIELGAKFVGGCCRNDANKIAEIRKFLDNYSVNPML